MYVNCDGLELETIIESKWVIDRPNNFREDKRFEKTTKLHAKFLGSRIDDALIISSFKSLINSYYNKKLKKKIYNMDFFCACHLYINKESLLAISLDRECLGDCLATQSVVDYMDTRYFVCLDYYKVKRLDYFVSIIFNHVTSH